MANFDNLILQEDASGNPHGSLIESVADNGMRLFDLERMLFEIRNQPPFRLQMDKEADYYDGNQLDAETLWAMEERGQAPLITNLIKPTIDVVLGMEAKTRTDWKVRPEGDKMASADLAEALSMKLHEAEVESRADRACSDAYAHQIKVGLGWVEVSSESDPFKGRYRVQSVHRREMFWDYRAKQPDMSDARYLIRRQWIDEDIACAAFPCQAALIRAMIGGLPINDLLTGVDTGLASALDTQRRTTIEQQDWINVTRRLVCIYEVWYRKIVRGYVMRLPNGRVAEFNQDDERHCSAALAGIVRPEPATFMKPHLAWWIGPHKAHDGPSPYQHRHFPYVPFIGFREDKTGIPYGLIRSMLSPQDEVNARKSKMMCLLSSKRVITDGDAVDDHNATAAEIGRSDAYVILNENRKPTSTFKVEDGGQLAAQQFQVMTEAKQEINQSAGIYQSMLGATSQATSGLAINSLVEQGTTTLAEINDNYRYARRQVGEILMELVKQDLLGKQVPVEVGEGADAKIVTLNQVAQDQQTGYPVILNDVSRVPVRVVLDDTPSTPTFRMQQLNQITELTKALPPQAQAMIIDFVIESTDLPKRREMADRLRKGLGIQTGEGQPDPQVQALQEQLQQLTGLMEQGKAAYEQQIASMQEQMAEAQKAAQDKSRELQIKETEAENKGFDIAESKRLESERIALDRERMATEERIKTLEVQARDLETQSNERIAVLNAQIAERQKTDQGEAAEEQNEIAQIVSQINETVGKSIEQIMQEIKQLKDRETAEKPESEPSQLSRHGAGLEDLR